MAQVAALYRYPVKGFTPEPCDVISVQADGRIAGDRVLVFRFADTKAPSDGWGPKTEAVVLMNTPGLARLRLRFDEQAARLRIDVDGSPLADEGLDPVGRARLAAAVTDFVLGLGANPLTGYPERIPLRLDGDGVTPRFQDREPGFVTLHSRESLASLASALADPTLSERRFRSNIAIHGVAAWEEQEWVGRTVRIGHVEFRVAKSVQRCLAPHANPDTGVRDLPILTTLTGALGQDEPTFAVAMELIGGGGRIRVGDHLEL